MDPRNISYLRENELLRNCQSIILNTARSNPTIITIIHFLGFPPLSFFVGLYQVWLKKLNQAHFKATCFNTSGQTGLFRSTFGSFPKFVSKKNGRPLVFGCRCIWQAIPFWRCAGPQKLLLMEEILHHLGCIKPCNYGIKYLSTGEGYLPSTVVRPFESSNTKLILGV